MAAQTFSLSSLNDTDAEDKAFSQALLDLYSMHRAAKLTYRRTIKEQNKIIENLNRKFFQVTHYSVTGTLNWYRLQW